MISFLKELEQGIGRVNQVAAQAQRIEPEKPECSTCVRYANGGPSHEGSRLCRCGSIASGGTKAHCTCRACW